MPHTSLGWWLCKKNIPIIPRRKITPWNCPHRWSIRTVSLTARRSLSGHHGCDLSKNHGKKRRDAPAGTALTPSPSIHLPLSLPAWMPTQLHSRSGHCWQQGHRGCCLHCISLLECFSPPREDRARVTVNIWFCYLTTWPTMQAHHICPIWPRRNRERGSSPDGCGFVKMVTINYNHRCAEVFINVKGCRKTARVVTARPWQTQEVLFYHDTQVISIKLFRASLSLKYDESCNFYIALRGELNEQANACSLRWQMMTQIFKDFFCSIVHPFGQVSHYIHLRIICSK